jgi:hypothetical protein
MKQDHELDAALRRVMAAAAVPRADEDAAERIVLRLESSALPAQKRVFAWWPSALMNGNFTPAWPRVAALAVAAVLGISVGLSGLGTRIASDLDLIRAASADDTASNVFDLDLGLRP